MWPTYESIKWFYDINAYTNEDIATYVELGVTTKAEYKQITGKDYTEQPQA